MKILIAGKSGTGKDYLAGLMMKNGLKLCKSYATRPPRYEGEDTHVFISKEEADAIPEKEKFAKTVINGFDYFTTGEQAYANDMFTMDPQGIRDITSAMPEEIFFLVYMYADEKERKNRAVARSMDPEKEGAVFDSRAAHEKELFDPFENQLRNGEEIASNLVYTMVFNNYEEETLDNAARTVMAQLRLQRTVDRIVDWACENDVLEEKDGCVGVVCKDMRKEYLPKHIFANMVISEPEGFRDLVCQYFMKEET